MTMMAQLIESAKRDFLSASTKSQLNLIEYRLNMIAEELDSAQPSESLLTEYMFFNDDFIDMTSVYSFIDNGNVYTESDDIQRFRKLDKRWDSLKDQFNAKFEEQQLASAMRSML